jgi:hypothetical protein
MLKTILEHLEFCSELNKLKWVSESMFLAHTGITTLAPLDAYPHPDGPIRAYTLVPTNMSVSSHWHHINRSVVYFIALLLLMLTLRNDGRFEG